MSFKTEEAAETKAKAALKTMPNEGKGWTIRVWENMGWHFNIQRGLASINWSDHGENCRGYWCMITDDPERVGTGSCRWSKQRVEYSDTPYAAFEAERLLVQQHINTERVLLSELEAQLALI